MGRRLTAVPGLATLATIAACSGGDAASVPVERTDSAGVELVRSLGEDVPLSLTTELLLTLGGQDQGPEAFYGIGNFGIDTDAAGAIYVLDSGNGQVHVFHRDGTHARSVGRRGGGPGELGQFVYAMSVAPDGSIGVFDFEKRGIVRWGPEGDVLPTIEVQGQPNGGFEMLAGGQVAAAFQDHDFQGDSARYALRVLRPDGSREELAELVKGGMHPVDFSCVRISGMTPLFQPEMEFDVAGDAFVISSTADYRVEVRSRDGSLRRILSRDIPLVEADAEIAAVEADSMHVSFGGGGGCTIPAAEVVEQRGFEPVVPAVRQLIGTPDGGVWVQRGYGKEGRVIDVFDASGAYTGTLPAGTTWPAAFLDAETVLVRTEDDFGREMVEVRRLVRSP